MASNLVVARGGVEFVPPISLAFWRWTVVFLLLLPFNASFMLDFFDLLFFLVGADFFEIEVFFVVVSFLYSYFISHLFCFNFNKLYNE